MQDINSIKSSVRISKLIPTLYTLKIEETIEFYVQILGFTCETYNSDLGWANLSFGHIELNLSIPITDLQNEIVRGTNSFYFITEDVEMFWETVKEKAKVCYPIEDFQYGMREFAIYDNLGNLLQFGRQL